MNNEDFLERTYKKWFGEAETKSQVYGYWLFLLAVILGLVALLSFWSSTLVDNRTPFRKAAITVSAIALPLLILGVIYRLPLRKKTRFIGMVGAVISIIGAILMHIYFRELWAQPTATMDMEIISIYGIGLLIIGFTGLILPIKTKQEEPSETKQEKSLETKQKERSAFFEVYEDEEGKWRWRLLAKNGEIIADSGQGFESRSYVNESINIVKSFSKEADVLEIKNGAFGIYEDEEGKWRWRLNAKNGEIIADSGQGYSTKGNCKRSVNTLMTKEEPNFEIYEDEAGEYRWRIITKSDEILADSGEGYTQKGNAKEAVERTKDYIKEADLLDITKGAFDVYEDEEGKWRWRLIAKNGEIVADSGQGYTSKQNSFKGIISVRENAPNADLKEI